MVVSFAEGVTREKFACFRFSLSLLCFSFLFSFLFSSLPALLFPLFRLLFSLFLSSEKQKQVPRCMINRFAFVLFSLDCYYHRGGKNVQLVRVYISVVNSLITCGSSSCDC